MSKSIAERITLLELGLEQLKERCDVQDLVLSWLLAKHPDDEVLLFLRSQANEFESADPRKWQEWIDTLDNLTEDVVGWRALWSSGPDTPR